MYKIVFSKQAIKDMAKIKQVKSLSKVTINLLKVIQENPYANPPEYEKLIGDLAGYFSRRINKQHRLVYKVEDDTVKVYRMWTHYD